MKVLMVEPEKKPYVKELAGDLQSMQKAVGGLIECVYPYMDPVGIVCNEEGKLLGLPLNRAIYSDAGEMVDIIAGNFFVTRLEGEGFADLTDTLLDKYMKMFQSPELFISLNGKIMAIPVPTEELQNIAFGKVDTQDVSAEAPANHPRRIHTDAPEQIAEEIADYALQQQTLQETAAQEAETQLAEVMLE